MIGKAINHFFDSKTYTLLLGLVLIALIAAVVADWAFSKDLWDRFFDQILGSTITGGARAVAVDGAPKVAAALKDPNSTAANPPPAVTAPISSTNGGPKYVGGFIQPNSDSNGGQK